MMQRQRQRTPWQPHCAFLLPFILSLYLLLPLPAYGAISFTAITTAGPFQPRREGAFELLPIAVTYRDPDTGASYTAGSPARPLYVLHGFQGSLNNVSGTMTPFMRNDVWLSSDSGAHWTLVAGWSAPSPLRVGAADGHALTSFTNASYAASFIDKQSRLFRIGGEAPEYYTNVMTSEVWMSTNAKDWTRQSNGRFSPPRTVAAAIADSANALYLVGGKAMNVSTRFDYYTGDVWRSANQGRDWTLQTAAAQFSPRGHAVLLQLKNSRMLQGKDVLLLLGGYGPYVAGRNSNRPYNDVS